MLAACNVQEQANSYKRIISPAINGDVLSTLSQLDRVDRFRNPLLNIKYQKLKSKYHLRFRSEEKDEKALSQNEVINDICAFYQEYWKNKLLKVPQNCDSILYDKIAHYLTDKQLSKLSFQELSETVKDDSELKKVIENEGFHCKFLLNNGIQDALIWDEQDRSTYAVELPETTINVNVIFIENYILNGVSDYATFGYSQIGGWASNQDASLFCNKGSYQLKSEKFNVSYLKHESIHFLDIANYPNLESADLEYRAKLVELIYCTKRTIYDRLEEFILAASKENRENAHPFANYHLIEQLSQKLFKTAFEGDILKWKTLTPEEINHASLDIFQKGTQLLKNEPLTNTIIEDLSNIN
ncbi:MAG: hypothetical protein EP338_06640 [Bacteroidetes bacterium]|nr:MAG: hypothetical protein EP338_06640 [Bacteroidota bacterium]